MNPHKDDLGPQKFLWPIQFYDSWPHRPLGAAEISVARSFSESLQRPLGAAEISVAHSFMNYRKDHLGPQKFV